MNLIERFPDATRKLAGERPKPKPQPDNYDFGKTFWQGFRDAVLIGLFIVLGIIGGVIMWLTGNGNAD
jgi:hypothetical protein